MIVKQLKELWAYQEMVIMLVRRDLRGRYKGSMLGFLWTFLNPLLQLAVYTAVFSVIMRAGIDKYYIFLFVALIPWMFIASSVQAGCTCILGQSTMVTKIYFPRMVLPIAHATTCFVNMLLCFVVVLVVCGVSVGINLIALPYLIPTMIIEYILALGLTLIVSAVTVYFRDMEHLMGIFVMAWQFLSPVMYSVDMVPGVLQPVFMLNPMTAILISYRDILYYKKPPNLSSMFLALVMGLIFLALGWMVFTNLERHFAEEL